MNTIFIENIQSYQNWQSLFFFSHKKFIKIFIKLIFLEHSLTYIYIYIERERERERERDRETERERLYDMGEIIQSNEEYKINRRNVKLTNN